MLALISRVLIVIVVFLAGTLAGNLFMPQKRLEQAFITSISEPKTALNLTREPNFDGALKAAQSAGIDAEVLDLMKRALLAEAYKAARAEYELELLKVQNNPTRQSAFLKAQDNYQKMKALLEQTFPPKDTTPAEAITPPAEEK